MVAQPKAKKMFKAEATMQGRRNNMKKTEKKMLIKHIKKDDKEFRGQIKDDVKLKKSIMSKKSTKC
jgi:hypothetical protein